MANLDKLTELDGAIGAVEFTPSGELISARGDLTEDVATMAAKICAANSLMGTIQSEGFTRFNREGWTPFYGWAFAAGDFSVCVMGHLGVVVEIAKANFNDIFKVLGQEAHISTKAA